MRKFSIAIVGGGPAGYFAAQALQNLQRNESKFSIDIFERLPTPWGLVRSGVAPDHPKIKTVSKIFEKIASQADVRLLANVNVGTDVTLDELKSMYDSVVIASGTPRGRSLGIPGEKLSNVISSADFVYWYNGHPDYSSLPVDLSGTRAVVIGAGNVAMDVGRMLVIDPDELDETDTADYALEAFHKSSIRDVTVVARRSAEHVAFTSPELRELSDLESIQVTIKKKDISEALHRVAIEPENNVKKNLDVMSVIVESPKKIVDRNLRFLFEHIPIEIKGEAKVKSVVFDTPDGRVEIPCDLLVTAIGYAPNGIPGLEIDGNKYLNIDGHVKENLYIVGWAKRGPIGVIGTNKSDSTEVMSRLVSSLTGPKSTQDVLPLLLGRGVKVVEQSGWNKINEFELSQGVLGGRPRVKITDVENMLQVASNEH